MHTSFGLTQSRLIIAVTSVVMSIATGSTSRAQSTSDPQVRKAIKYLNDEKHAKDIFGILHFGSKMGVYEIKTLHGVAGPDGDRVPGAFALKVVYDWDSPLGANVTTATFFFNKDGYVTGIDAKSTSVFSPPFDVANGTMQVVGELLISLALGDGGAFREATGRDASARRQVRLEGAADALDERPAPGRAVMPGRSGTKGRGIPPLRPALERGWQGIGRQASVQKID